MFDTIRCDYELPIPEKQDPMYINSLEFQTKSFDCLLDDYFIDTKGNLHKYHREREITPPKDIKSKNLLDRLPRMKVVSEELKPETFTGSITMYASEMRNSLCTDLYLTYFVQFDKGVVSSVEIKSFELKNNQKRKDIEQQFYHELEQRKKLLKKWYMKWVPTWNLFIRRLSQILYKLHSKCQKLAI